MPPFTIEPGSDANVAVVRCEITNAKWEQWFLLQSDIHWDNPDCDRRLYKRHLDLAKQRHAGILQFGDTFCAMQGKYDKRGDKSKVRPEHQSGDYLDALVRTFADDHAPYSESLLVLGQGNHETAIRSKHETDLIQRCVGTLRDRNPKCRTLVGGYSGYIRFNFQHGSTRSSKRLWYIHGYGGGGPVTKDTIQANRQQTYISDADIMVSGHTHHLWEDFSRRVRLNDMNRIEQVDFAYLKCGTYKDEWKTGAGGWHVETGKGPRPLGGWWLRFFTEHDHATNHRIVRFSTERAC